jgi:hypothetical protein
LHLTLFHAPLVIVTIEGDDFEYWVEIVTPHALSSHMENNKENFLEPEYTFIFVRELTPLVIRETFEAFSVDKENAFWLKLCHLTVEWNIHDLNTILDRQKRRLFFYLLQPNYFIFHL